MKIAVEGCAHGCLDKIYDALEHIQRTQGTCIDLLICCGDFQAVRNRADLNCMAVPPKYREMGTFYKYYSGEKVAPVLTIFIGGNHEASNHLQELAYGGWVAPRIYYLGYAGVVRFGGLRIGGVSGIYKGRDFLQGHFEAPPYNGNTIRSAYHVRNLEVFRLKQLKQPMDIFISHDWPRGVYHYGNLNALLRFKPYFRNEVESNQLGSRPCQELLERLQPRFWFAAHLHVKFAALVPHKPENGSPAKVTKFLALDKCLPRRQFLQVLDIPQESQQPLELQHDPEWLAVLHSTNHLLSVKNVTHYMPGPGHPDRWSFTPTEQEIRDVVEGFGELKISESLFSRSVPAFDPNQSGQCVPQPTINPQTTAFCGRLKVDDPLSLVVKGDFRNTSLTLADIFNQSEANVTVDTSVNCSQVSLNPDEITLSENGDSDDKDEEAVPKEPGLSGLALPAPLVSGAESAEGSPVSHLEEKRSSSSCSEGKRSAEEEEAVPLSAGPLKRFKRRNLSLYTSTSDDD